MSVPLAFDCLQRQQIALKNLQPSKRRATPLLALTFALDFHIENHQDNFAKREVIAVGILVTVCRVTWLHWQVIETFGLCLLFSKRGKPKSASGGKGALVHSIYFFSFSDYNADWYVLHNKGKHFSRLLTNIMNIFPFCGTWVFIAVSPSCTNKTGKEKRIPS